MFSLFKTLVAPNAAGSCGCCAENVKKSSLNGKKMYFNIMVSDFKVRVSSLSLKNNV